MKKIKVLFTLLTVSLLSVSCLVDDEVDNSFANSPYIVGFEQKSATNSYFEDEGVVYVEYPVSLLGGQSGSLSPNDITLSYSVDTARSTAQEGVEFSLPLGGVLVLPANSHFTMFPININTGNFDPSAPTSVFIDLAATSSDATVSEINKTIEIKFVGCLSTVDAETYEVYFDYTNLDGDFFDDVYAGTQTISLFDGTPNVFFSQSTPPWGPGALAPGYDGYIFEVICGDVFIETQYLGGYWGNTVEGMSGDTNATGSVDETTGDINIQYKVCYAGNCRFLDVTYYKQ